MQISLHTLLTNLKWEDKQWFINKLKTKDCSAKMYLNSSSQKAIVIHQNAFVDAKQCPS